MKKILAGLLTSLALCVVAQAEMITVGGDQTAGTGTLTINQDINFSITGNASQLFFVFDEVVISDGAQTTIPFADLEYSVNGGSHFSLLNWTDNLGTFANDGTPNDGYLDGDHTTVGIGDTVTLHAGTGTMQVFYPDFNPWASGDYDTFLVNGSGLRVSENGVVPEPATAGLFGISGLLIFIIRRHFLN